MDASLIDSLRPKVSTTGAVNSVLLLIDEPIDHDKRVQLWQQQYPQSHIHDCIKRQWFPIYAYILGFLISVKYLLKASLSGQRAWGYLEKQYNVKAPKIIGKLSLSLKKMIKAYCVAQQIQKKHKAFDLIIANDLFCATVAYFLKRKWHSSLIYDAHELEFHRNRDNSWLRSAFDIEIERAVIAKSDSVIVVNQPIADIYQDMYVEAQSKLMVINNNHFTSLKVKPEATDSLDEVAFIYVGGGIRGRMLLQLAKDAKKENIDVYGFFLNHIPEEAKLYAWHLGQQDYVTELMALKHHKRLLMWCCLDDVCLSYRLALTNKFFQALALAIPVVASQGTYMARLCQRYQLGYIYDGHNMAEIKSMSLSDDYDKKVEACYQFQQELDSSALTL